MAEKFRIAVCSGVHAQTHVERLLARFTALQVNCECLWIDTATCEEILLSGYADAAVSFLEDLPVEQPEGLLIAAVVERSLPGEWLVVSPSATDPNQSFKLAEKVRIWAPDPRRQSQMKDFRPDLQFDDRPVSEPEAWECLLSGEMPAALLRASFVKEQQTLPETFHLQKFNPKELIPAPGQGALAMVACREDHSTRKILQGVHRPEISALTNIERGCLRMTGNAFRGKLGVYGERDAHGNYHIKAVWAPYIGHLRKASLSSSTNFQLAERILSELGILQEKHPTL